MKKEKLLPGDKGYLEASETRSAVYMSNGEWFTVFLPLDQFTEEWTRALRQRDVLILKGGKRYGLNPFQIALAEGKSTKDKANQPT